MDGNAAVVPEAVAVVDGHGRRRVGGGVERGKHDLTWPRRPHVFVAAHDGTQHGDLAHSRTPRHVHTSVLPAGAAVARLEHHVTHGPAMVGVAEGQRSQAGIADLAEVGALPRSAAIARAQHHRSVTRRASEPHRLRVARQDPAVRRIDERHVLHPGLHREEAARPRGAAVGGLEQQALSVLAQELSGDEHVASAQHTDRAQELPARPHDRLPGRPAVLR